MKQLETVAWNVITTLVGWAIGGGVILFRLGRLVEKIEGVDGRLERLEQAQDRRWRE